MYRCAQALVLVPLLACSSGPAGTESPAAAAVAGDSPSACDPLATRWDACVGQEIEVSGAMTPPEEVMNHPSLRGPVEVEGQWEGTLSAGGQQVPFLTTDPRCPGAMTLRGTLSSVNLGGAPGTRGAYSGYAVSNARITCG